MLSTDVSFGAFILALTAILVGILVAVYSCQKKTAEKEIDSYLKEYSSFTANGIVYMSEDIIDYEYSPRSHENDVVIFKTKNGDEIHIIYDAITWHKNK